MFFFSHFALFVRSEEEILGTYSRDNSEFLPGLPKDLLDGRGTFVDYGDERLPLKGLLRFVATFKTPSDDIFALQELFGHITNPDNAQDFFFNFSSNGYTGRITNEETTTFTFYLDLRSHSDPGKYGLDIFAKLADATHQRNVSALIFNKTVEMYEVTDIKSSLLSAVTYLFFVVVLAGILLIIFSKDKRTALSESQAKSKSKKKVKDYADIHATNDRSSSPGGKGKERKQSPRK